MEVLKSIYNELNRKKLAVDKKLEELSKKIEKKQEKFISLVADKFSLALVLEELKQPTPRSVMLQEAYKVYAKENDKELEELKKEIEELNEKEEFYKKRQEKLKEQIAIYKRDRDEYMAKKAKKDEIYQKVSFG